MLSWPFQIFSDLRKLYGLVTSREYVFENMETDFSSFNRDSSGAQSPGRSAEIVKFTVP